MKRNGLAMAGDPLAMEVHWGVGWGWGRVARAWQRSNVRTFESGDGLCLQGDGWFARKD